MRRSILFAAAFGLLAAFPGTGSAADVVHVYSGRHYDSDQALFDGFKAATGIEVRLLEASADSLIERMRQEGTNSPADVLITVDAGRLWRAREAGLLQPVRSSVLEAAIPAHLRDPDGYWFGLARRARVLAYAVDRVKPEQLTGYRDLAEPQWRGRILVRSSTNVYNQSLTGALMAAWGPEATESWARGLVANFARPPQGGDTDQIKAVAAGEGDVAIVNHYYYARLAASPKPEDQAIAAKVGVVFPDQAGAGTHVNISGAGVAANAPNRVGAVRFLDYLVSPAAQAIFAEANYEYPAIAGVSPHPVIAAWGPFKEDTLNAAVYGRNNAEALRLMDRAGWR